MFGVLSCRNGRPDQDYCLAIGVAHRATTEVCRSGSLLGSRVFCCDNLAFSGRGDNAPEAHAQRLP